MTAETSNARGELRVADIREDAREPLQLLREKLAHDEDGWAALCQLMPMLAAAPPPAAARREWVLVPRVPTEAMLDAMHSRIRILCDPAECTAAIQNDREVWAAMLAAAPPAPVSVPLDRLTALDGLVDRIAEAIRDGAGLAEGDPPWERLGEERRAPWRADAKRALSVIKESLTAEMGAGVGEPDVQPAAEALFMADSVHNQAMPGTREGDMVVLETDAAGKPTIWCDPEIVDLVRALNDGGLRTVASCSGHGGPFGIVTLKDGRELLVLPDFDTARKAERALAAALAAEAQQQGQESGGEVIQRHVVTKYRDGSVHVADVAAPPSAPVGVELSALRVQEWLHREHDILCPVQEIEQAMRTPCSCPFTERALAQQPAAVDEAMELVRDIAEQKPEKPDYWSSCGQCESNIDRAQEVLAAQHQEPKS